ncbi:MAG: hypothetical protein ABR922_11685 [Streptosporangiaceae bacterium]|jgi:hypothetical protein
MSVEGERIAGFGRLEDGALEVFALDGGRDIDFLGGVFYKLLANFPWWVNRQDAGDKNVFEGGFLGLSATTSSTAVILRSSTRPARGSGSPST